MSTFRQRVSSSWSGLTGCYAVFLAAPAVPYALYLTRETVHRSDADELAGAAGWAAVTAWSLATTVPLFAALGALSAGAAYAVARYWPRHGRFIAASIIQGGMLTFVLAWAYVNQAVDYYSGEALTFGTLHFVWENAAEVFQTTWKLARWRLGGVGVGMAVAFVGLSVLVHRLNRPCYHRNEAAPPVPRTRRSGRVVLAVAVVLLAGCLAVQFVVEPSLALVELSRTSPPLRFLDLTRRLVDSDLRIDIPDSRGVPILSDEAYAATMVAEARPPRNVMLILLESIPASALSCYGYHRNVSPHLDALAAEGVMFENCIAASSFSAYSQISIFTSLYMLRGRANDHFRNRDFPFRCLHSVLKLRGYELAAISSGNEGFENIDAFLGPSQFDLWFTRNTAGLPESEQFDANRMDDKHATAKLAEWIASRDRSRPFFCYMNLQSTHFDYWIPEPWASHYQPILPWLSSGNGIVRIPPEQVQPLRNQFDNALRYLDHFVGRIRETLHEAGYGEDTILVLVGDHGEAFMEHGTARHGMHLFQEVIHVPLIIHAPGLLGAQRRPEWMSQLDIAPTITGLLGLRPHPAWQGVDVLAKDRSGQRRPVFSVLQLSRMQEAVILDGWKYVFDFSDCRDYLFALDDDPGERRNLARRDPEQLAALRGVLSAFHSHQLRYYEEPARHTRHYIGEVPLAGLRPEP